VRKNGDKRKKKKKPQGKNIMSAYATRDVHKKIEKIYLKPWFHVKIKLF